ncbi:MAG: (Fe-S)-binding protein [Bacteroidetes bacterium]|nr:(Fe-S)-binding protein [Bacteroidota bacterium]MBV6461666.1 putative iron-sulfur-binding oxidoreductase FadF [Flavobacteriales bacterium]WKZ74144.1 MAG: (Fe-S)-binding protein [Vicingaceae bacterium]MCL4816817.1 (Fe-S)-binding protein [Flavobacteriales bacterium]NOG95755.1 (Fe-S)-binding protein [Bacteroidota bacterium]
MGTENIIFLLLFLIAFTLFFRNATKIKRNIFLGKKVIPEGSKSARLKTMLKVALGQSKMTVKPVAGILHILVYAGFVIINLEMLEIVIDGIFGTHRIFSFAGSFYNSLIASFEVLALMVLVSCLIFFIRRNLLKLSRFRKPELNGWPRNDANLILITEVFLMSAFLIMNAADATLQQQQVQHYVQSGCFPVSSLFASSFIGLDTSTLIFIERFCWWFHIVGILVFLNYLPYSKHLHIILSFPNTYFSKLKPKGELNNMESVTREVKLMLDPEANPYASQPDSASQTPERFGAKDVFDLNRIQLLNAYSCTECGRCTSECPANNTGKKLSPRKIMMDVRDRLEEVGKGIDKHGSDYRDEKTLSGNYISEEEILACTTCNACTQACPINIDPLSIIIELRRNLLMEESKAPAEWAGMLTNIENNGAPWQFSQADRLKWSEEN